ncbi:MAG: elongation factor G [Crocosphaera sp.]|nr:elongation factor G [Crocosphaera sp.]
MINLTLPQWLQPKDSVSTQPQLANDDTINNNHVEQVIIKQQQPSPDNLSLTYLDDYIHQWF